MTRHLDVDRALEDWLAEGPSQLPEHAIDGIVRQLNETNQRRPSWLPGRERMNRIMFAVGGLTAALVLLVVAAPRFLPSNNGTNVGGQPSPTLSPAPITGSLPAEQTAVIARHAAALNSRDAEAFVDVFAAHGGFDPRGSFAASSSLFANTLPIADRFLVEPFMAMNEAWGFEAEVVTCDRLSRSEFERRYGLHHDSIDVFGQCAVKSRWPTLSLEIGEWWYYEFNGASIVWWGQTVRDAPPVDRALSLDLDGLLEWEAWLESTDADAAARLLNPRVYPVTVPCGDGLTFADETHTTTAPPEPPCEWSSDDGDVERITSDGNGRGEDGWVVAGQRFSPSALIPYDPAMADEIETSIEEFLVR